MPMTPTSIPITFKWKDAFDRGTLFFSKQSLSQLSLTRFRCDLRDFDIVSGLTYGSFERACVLFNIAALQSQIAAVQTLATEEELKCAAKMFQARLKDFRHTL